MICPFCNKEIKDDSKFCGKCGHKIPRCPTCGKVIRKWMLFCTDDGTPLPKDVIDLFPDTYQPPKGNPDIGDHGTSVAGNKGTDYDLTPSSTAYATTQDNVKQKKNKKKKSIIPVLISIIIILSGALATFTGYTIWKFQSAPQETDNIAENQSIASNSYESNQKSPETSQTGNNESDNLQTDFNVDTENEEIPQEDSTSIIPDTDIDNHQSTDKLQYFIAHCDTEYFTEDDLQTFDADMCRIARNSIYARLGRKFDDQNLTTYFEQYDWYAPTIDPDNFSEEMLNEYQIANRDLIVSFETKKGYR